MAAKLIQQLTSIPGLKVECPSCSESFLLKRGRLFSMYEKAPQKALGIMQTRMENAKEQLEDAKERRLQLKRDRKRKPLRISVSTEATNFGQRCEQIIPAFVDFPYSQADCRILLKPVDYIVFQGVCETGQVEGVKFVEFKTGAGMLGLKQRQIRNCIAGGKVTHEVIGQ